MGKIFAPFTPEQIKKLQAWQTGFIEDAESPFFVEFGGIKLYGNATPPFTCCSHDGCDRMNQPNDGALIPKENGFVCPCGKYTQDWCHDFMVE